MKPKYSIATVLLITSAIAITLGGMQAYIKLHQELPTDWNWTFDICCLTGPFWVPVAFVTYAIGRKAFSGWMVAAFALAEATAVAMSYLKPPPWWRY